MEAVSTSKSHLPVHMVSPSQKTVTFHHCCENFKIYIKLHTLKKKGTSNSCKRNPRAGHS
jgi:hypothetical protein